MAAVSDAAFDAVLDAVFVGVGLLAAAADFVEGDLFDAAALLLVGAAFFAGTTFAVAAVFFAGAAFALVAAAAFFGTVAVLSPEGAHHTYPRHPAQRNPPASPARRALKPPILVRSTSGGR
ncbi:MAG: hypothetical protein WKF47_10260 [Geodermatophilaceae bacterium]